MTRFAPIETQVTWRFDQSRPEVIVPDSICHDTCEERIANVSNPVGQIHAAMRFDRVWLQAEAGFESSDSGQAGGSNFFTQHTDAASLVDFHRRRLSGNRSIDLDGCGFTRLSMLQPQICQLVLPSGPSGPIFRAQPSRNLGFGDKRVGGVGCDGDFFRCQCAIV